MKRVLRAIDTVVSFLYLFLLVFLLLELAYCAVKFSQGGTAYVKDWLIHIQIEGRADLVRTDMNWLQAITPQLAMLILAFLLWIVHGWVRQRLIGGATEPLL